jgi:hypothetical protein
MLVSLIYPEKRKDKYENKNIIHTERIFNHIAGKKLERFGPAHIKVNNNIKEHRQSNPDQCRDHRLFDRYLANFSMKNPEIKNKHQHDESIESNPKTDMFSHLWLILICT